MACTLQNLKYNSCVKSTWISYFDWCYISADSTNLKLCWIHCLPMVIHSLVIYQAKRYFRPQTAKSIKEVFVVVTAFSLSSRLPFFRKHIPKVACQKNRNALASTSITPKSSWKIDVPCVLSFLSSLCSESGRKKVFLPFESILWQVTCKNGV